jgi:flagellar hook-basal body complex protein FliE
VTSIAGISAMSGMSGLTGVAGAIGPVGPAAVGDPTGLAGAATGDSSGFAAQLTQSLVTLQSLQAKSDDLAIKAATGSLTDVHDYTIAATEASLATKLTVAVRDKAVGAFNEIMRMQG